MPRIFRRRLAAILALILLVLGLLLTLTQWLPRLVGIWLPPDTRVELEGSPRWRNGGLWFPHIRYLADDCVLASVDAASLGWHPSRWQLNVGQAALNTDCLQKLPASGDQPTAPKSLAEWQAMLPGATIHVDKFVVAPWQTYAGRLDLKLESNQQQLHFQGDILQLDAVLQGQQLHINSLTLKNAALTEPVTLKGQLELPEFADGLPVNGKVEGKLALGALPGALDVTLNWQQQQGLLSVAMQGIPQPLLNLPWQASADQIHIEKGQYYWPLDTQPLSGFINLTLDNWRSGLEGTRITGRFNLLTQGRGGKGNVVLNIGPGKLSLTQSQLPFQLTGESKLAAIQLYGTLPGELNGPVLDPLLTLKPGALLRSRGRLLSTLEVDEARWPLAGVRLSSQGIDGRLQAILKAHDPSFGRFTLHLDGRANNFWPDKGEWNWHYWGTGEMVPLNARWDVTGTGGWQGTLIHLDTLSTGFNQLKYAMVQASKPRLTLTAPVNWQRDPQHPSFNGGFQMKSGQTQFSYGGWLPDSELEFEAKGRDPSDFVWRGQLKAEAIGPLRVHGRWDGERLRGEAWWPSQSLTVFQPLLSQDLKMKIQSGELRAQVAFSAAPGQGFEAGGHWTVKQGSVWTPDSQINGVDFSLPFRLKNQRWQLGVRGPVSLRIAEVKNQFALQNIRADLQGAWPWSESHPLTLQDVSLDVLGGQITLPSLRMPQHEAARVSLRDISLSKLITAIKPRQFAMSGKINGELPLWLNNQRWLVEDGWIANSGPLTFRMDKDMSDAITHNNVATGAALDWLRYMEISRSWATLNLDTLGALTMKAQVQGVSRFSNRNQTVNLNYRHQENLFQLWRSLRFGDNLQSWVEQNATLPVKKDHHP
ncbi:MAG: YdbH family protein [Enterobacterales bacterium endosymbiont of Blomia tropicalis]|uniref:YdbH family protein n=1 Tax=Mixta mediterraneensis TaxID=2758443 RepID=UPI0025A7E74B|nr:YdbH family protein [Mixta mediterraneensis]MDL4912445.1 YdbH family protein [Mixta mediterraneensis]